MNHTFAPCKHCHTINRIQLDKVSKAICGKCHQVIPFHGLVSEANQNDFEKIISISDKPVVVDFWASWCGPCKMYGPEFEKASIENTSAVFLKINTESEQSLSSRLGIRGIPCTLFFKNGREVKRQSGAMDSSTIKNLLNSI